MKTPFIIYADTESLPKNVHACDNNPEESSTTKASKHMACGYSLFTHCSFDNTKNKSKFYRGAGCTNKFCADLKDMQHK